MAALNFIPKDKFDTDAVERARRVGFPKLNPLLPEMLEWVKDANWPVAPGMAEFLSEAGPEIVPHIKTILKSKDSVWKYWILELVFRNLDTEVQAELREDLMRLSKYPATADTAEKVDVVARSIARD